MITLLVFIVVISLLVFVHELGHFLTARRLGVGVDEFGFGFPPRIIGITRRNTIYSLNWIPFGGFVRLKGETPGGEAGPDSFMAQKASRRFVILAAGVVMNYLLAAILFTVGFSIGLPTAVDQNGSDRNHIKNVHTEIISTDPTGAADKAGIRSGDVVTHIGDSPVASAEALKSALQESKDAPSVITIIRNDSEQRVSVIPERSSDGQYRIGIGILDVGTLSYPFPQSIVKGTMVTATMTGQVFSSFGGLLRDLVIERKLSADLSGPVGVVVMTGQAVRLGFAYLIQFTALLSITLAVVNFFPLPALDGGRALFVIIEVLRRKPVNQRIESLVHAVGFYVLIGLVLLISIHDVEKFSLGSRIAQQVRVLFGG